MAAQKWSFKITAVRKVLIALAALAAAIAVYRLATGLGTTTNLNDRWPWGLWIGFDVLTGVALAGGGYSTALLVHILHYNKFNVIARSAMLTSLLGYLLVMVGLFLDIGRWFNFWRPFVSWGYHSVLFEVFWCISLYTLVQVIEFGEIATERVAKSWHKPLKKIMPVMLILGVLLPTLHQSSLGGLYVIEVGKLHPLWWSPLLPLFFLMSSFFVGPAMVTIETTLAGRALGHRVEDNILRSLIRIAGVLMVIYLALKIIDLVNRDAFGYVFAGGLESNMFLLEMIVGVIIPIIICFTPWSAGRSGLVTFGVLTAAGLVINRMNVVITGMYQALGPGYFPSWMEWAVTIGLVSGGVLVYLFIAENFNILGRHEEQETA
ncbi:Ni/Fe-hydrogenase subunit HybB-like protein [Desulfohalotomaculum tongense]|uniref:NrfD/PsrC family molybdoenzyme membrane anchor subunit n=1 Tax=Desulforadius tongensis TaxID=1216062 RepID=UPI001958DE22|nr:Ni/Fe-hydrogenase cytochrome b subunit [Desulforadius tongensis]MBM7855345.1 Ni/Fe-hydrogenase subunit HybB-like protein [Desulforadius tongensis]